jgi:predicted AlkP superfamily pyrophosphatase or phosphodiesterase
MKILFDGLKERGVEDCVNIIIVSDHGMATYNSSKLVHLKEVSDSPPMEFAYFVHVQKQ